MGDVEYWPSRDKRLARIGCPQLLQPNGRVLHLEASEQKELATQNGQPLLPSRIARNRGANRRRHHGGIRLFKAVADASFKSSEINLSPHVLEYWIQDLIFFFYILKIEGQPIVCFIVFNRLAAKAFAPLVRTFITQKYRWSKSLTNHSRRRRMAFPCPRDAEFHQMERRFRCRSQCRSKVVPASRRRLYRSFKFKESARYTSLHRDDSKENEQETTSSRIIVYRAFPIRFNRNRT